MFVATILAQLILSTIALVGGCLYLRYYVTRDEAKASSADQHKTIQHPSMSDSGSSDTKTSAAA